MAGKSAAKIRRNEARAAARGETYTPPPPPPPKNHDDNTTADDNKENDQLIQTKSKAAQSLETTLAAIETNPENLNSKDKRTAKRKAEAIAAEEAGVPAEELLEWYAQYKKTNNNNKTTNKKKRPRDNNDQQQQQQQEELSEEDKAKLASAKKLHSSLAKLEADESLNAKERRSAKRKAEAIATEETNCPAEELLDWYEKNHAPPPSSDKGEGQEGGKPNPYIVFVGQLSYSTTSDMLLNHFYKMLSAGRDDAGGGAGGGGVEPAPITKESIKVRLLTDSKTKKSRGMAFVEVDSPEVMYECLKLHLTHLDGRRINGE